MSIVFEKTIIHILDISHDLPILSAHPTFLTDETEAYITSYLTDLFDNHSMAHAIFEDTSLWLEVFKSDILDFEKFSCDLANQFFAYMQTFPSIPSGDLVVTQFKRDDLPYIAFFKLNYKEAYTHVVDQNEDGPINQLLKHKTIFHDTVSKVQEAAIINLETFKILLLDIHKEKYVHTLLGSTAPLSTKQKIKVVEQVIAD
ncbi:MAG: nucleoid-associated protein, partial [Niameybacter sp.]